ncbi:MAG: adenosylmethionine--8-amino-7-oxononanoate transaminase [Candidatus Omnitrophica bacterium]|nr:adenosylmethionine--8-amino-7-oxononanoate transaminase [Candidatus Omnitrophota bacterium]
MKGIFITGTDTGVGKTIATLVLGTLLQKQGYNVGVMKPVQCGGDDAVFLKKSLRLSDPLAGINPCFARAPLSPHLAFQRAKHKIDVKKIFTAYERLKQKHDILLVEGAGGLMVPLLDDYFVADLVRDLDLELVIVARSGLGTINHTLLTIRQARDQGITVRGVLFSEASRRKQGTPRATLLGLPEKTNPDVIRRLGNVSVLGTIPWLKSFRPQDIVRRCAPTIRIRRLLEPWAGVPALRQKQLVAWDKKYVWHPFTQMKDWLTEEPLVIDRARGSYLIDTQGHRYLDGVSSLWVNVHGHGHRRISAAVRGQLNKLEHSTFLGLSNTPAIELARKLVAIAPRGLAKVFYSDNGSTAVEAAIKIAYQYWQNAGRKEKRLIAHLANSYHGDTLGSVSVGGIELFHKVYRDLIFKTIKVDFPDCYRAPKGKEYPDYAFECLDRFETMLQKRHGQIAAFVVEPVVQGAAGMIMWPKGILKRMRELCRRYEVIFIADEVATGFGRTGKMFACEHEGVSPDILCLAKGITAGYLPLAATLTTRKIFDGFVADYKEQKTFFHGHTYTGNPLACAAALANLEVFEKEKTLARLAPKIKFLSRKLQSFYNLLHVGDVRQRGFMAGIELVRDRVTKEPYPWQEKIGVRVCQEVRKYGVILRPLGNVIVLLPPLSMTMEELERLLDVTYRAIEMVIKKRDTILNSSAELSIVSL